MRYEDRREEGADEFEDMRGGRGGMKRTK